MQTELNFDVRFNGADYCPELDNKRLGKQYLAIFDLMKDGQFRTLREISDVTGYGESSISAQLRHMRKLRFGGHTVNRQARGQRENGLFEYQLIIK